MRITRAADGSGRRMVDLGSLTGEARRVAWAHIQAHDPDTAALLQQPPDDFAALRQRFGAAVLYPIDQLPGEVTQ